MHLGPLGTLRRIHPLAHVSIKPERFGGVHTSLSGRRTVDYLGSASGWELVFPPRAPSDESAWIEACYYRHVPGPLRLLLDGLHTNRLSRSAASLGFGGRDMSGVALSAGTYAPGSGWPSATFPVGVPLQWSGWGVGDTLTLDKGQPAPVLPGETVTGSLWVHTLAYHTVHVALSHVTASGATATTNGPDTTIVPDQWTRLPVTATPPADVIGAYPSLVVDAADGSTHELTVTAAQLELGDTATDWQQGGGAPLVSATEMETTAPHVPLSQTSLTLLEL